MHELAETVATAREIIPRTFVVGASTLISRILGLVREIVTASLFGTSGALSLFLVAFTIPNLFRRLFGEGAMHAAFVPALNREMVSPDGDERRFFNTVMTALAALLGGITLLGWVGCWIAFRFGALSANGRTFCTLLAIMLPYLPLVCLSALQGSALNVKDRFLVPALTPALLNVCWIVAALGYGGKHGVYALAVGVLAAGVLQFGIQWPALWRAGLPQKIVWAPKHPGLRRLVRLMVPVAVGIGVIQMNVMVDRLIAYFCVREAGAVSVLHYGNRLMQFPLGVLGLALATAVFPSMARQAAQKDFTRLGRTVGVSLRMALFLALPCMAVLAVLGEPIVRLLFERGEFTADYSTPHTVQVLFWYALGLWAFCGVHVLTRAFYAMEDMTTPLRVAMAMVGANVALNLVLVWPMKESGLALASTLSSAGNVAILMFLLRRRLGGLDIKRVTASAAKSLVAAVLAGGAGYSVQTALTSERASRTIASVIRPITCGHGVATGAAAVTLATSLAVTGLVFLAVAWLLRDETARDLAGILPGRSKA